MCLKGLFTFKLGVGFTSTFGQLSQPYALRCLQNQSRSSLDAIHNSHVPKFYEAIDIASIISNDCVYDVKPRSQSFRDIRFCVFEAVPN